MKSFKVFKVYKVVADNKWEAMDTLRKAEEDGTWKALFEGQYAKEEVARTWKQEVKDQLFGKK